VLARVDDMNWFLKDAQQAQHELLWLGMLLTSLCRFAKMKEQMRWVK
jgi:hypothetical protein